MRRLQALVFVIGVAACGGAARGPDTAGTSSSGGTTGPASSGSGSATPNVVAPIGKPIAASAMASDLTALGLDPKALPPLDKLAPEKLRQVMKTFSKALGTNCNGCHDPNDFRAPTPNKRIASKMWNFYVRGLAMEDGSPLYCDSCHGGREHFLDRHDEKGLRAWMDANFVSKLKTVNGQPHSCESCHGDPFQPKFLAAWAKK